MGRRPQGYAFQWQETLGPSAGSRLCLGSGLFEQRQEISRSYDLYAFVDTELQQCFVTCHQVVGLSFDGARKDLGVLRIRLEGWDGHQPRHEVAFQSKTLDEGLSLPLGHSGAPENFLPGDDVG